MLERSDPEKGFAMPASRPDRMAWAPNSDSDSEGEISRFARFENYVSDLDIRMRCRTGGAQIEDFPFAMKSSKKKRAETSLRTASDEGPVTGHGMVGEQIRRLRKAHKMTLTDLAERTGLSAGYLSQVERNLCSPTIKAFMSICTALKVNVNWFFRDGDAEENGESKYIVRKEGRPQIRVEPGISDYMLNTKAVGDLEFLLVAYSPGSGIEEAYSHQGEEAGIVLSGQLKLWIDGEVHFLKEGDSFSFPSTLPHKSSNPTNEETTVLWCITPPTF